MRPETTLQLDAARVSCVTALMWAVTLIWSQIHSNNNWK